MDKSWLDRYPKAAAMLQGDDDVLLYAPQSCRGLEEEAPGTLEEFAARYISPTFAAQFHARPQDEEDSDRGDW